MNTESILKNLRCHAVEELNIEIKSYLENYSFSTVDILLSKREVLSLEIEDLYKKIIINKRGGYCFEHNKLFHAALISEGFKVSKQLARVIYGKDIDAPKTHRMNIVEVEGEEYLADVGFGAHTPNALIPLSGKEIKCPNGSTYRVYENGHGLFSLEVLRSEGFFAFYTFDMGEYFESDFNLSSYFSNTHPKSKHAHNLVMSINRDSTTLAILNGSLLRFLNGEKSREDDITSSENLKNILYNDFRLDLTEEESKYLYQNYCKQE